MVVMGRLLAGVFAPTVAPPQREVESGLSPPLSVIAGLVPATHAYRLAGGRAERGHGPAGVLGQPGLTAGCDRGEGGAMCDRMKAG
jgi:hypothetical protein